MSEYDSSSEGESSDSGGGFLFRRNSSSSSSSSSESSFEIGISNNSLRRVEPPGSDGNLEQDEDVIPNFASSRRRVLRRPDEDEWDDDDELLGQIIAEAMQGLKKKKKWCRMLEGKCFTNAGQAGNSSLPKCTLSADGIALTVPSMYVKDIKGVHEYVQKVHMPEDSVYLPKVQMNARKFNTDPLDLSGLLKGWKATKIGNRYFLDQTTGSVTAAVALKQVINTDLGDELVMPREPLQQLLSFARRTNKHRGYACCEVARVGPDWFSVINLQLLGPHEGRAEFTMSEKAKIILPMVGGKRYLKEFQEGRIPGTRKTHRMVEEYSSNNITSPLCAKDYIPTKWADGKFPEDPYHPKLEVPCEGLTYTVFPTGGIRCTARDSSLLIPKPLHGVTFTAQTRKSECVGLNKVQGSVPLVVDGYRTALSAIGASLLPMRPPTYFRIEKELQASLDQILQEQLGGNQDIFTLHCIQTLETHKAGMKGTFPIFKCLPILRISERWYNPFTLAAYRLEDYEAPKKLRYMDISIDPKLAKRKRPKKTGHNRIPTVETCPETISCPGSLTEDSKRKKQKKKKKTKQPSTSSGAQQDKKKDRYPVKTTTKTLADGRRIEEIEYSDGAQSITETVTVGSQEIIKQEQSRKDSERKTHQPQQPSIPEESALYEMAAEEHFHEQEEELFIPQQQEQVIFVPHEEEEKVFVPQQQEQEIFVPHEQEEEFVVPQQQEQDIFVPHEQQPAVFVPQPQEEAYFVACDEEEAEISFSPESTSLEEDISLPETGSSSTFDEDISDAFHFPQAQDEESNDSSCDEEIIVVLPSVAAHDKQVHLSSAKHIVQCIICYSPDGVRTNYTEYSDGSILSETYQPIDPPSDG